MIICDLKKNPANAIFVPDTNLEDTIQPIQLYRGGCSIENTIGHDFTPL